MDDQILMENQVIDQVIDLAIEMIKIKRKITRTNQIVRVIFLA